jgi:hypothetical protein
MLNIQRLYSCNGRKVLIVRSLLFCHGLNIVLLWGGSYLLRWWLDPDVTDLCNLLVLLLQAEAGEVRRMLEEASAQVAQQAAALSSMGEETDAKAAELAAAQVRQTSTATLAVVACHISVRQLAMAQVRQVLCQLSLIADKSMTYLPCSTAACQHAGVSLIRWLQHCAVMA